MNLSVQCRTVHPSWRYWWLDLLIFMISFLCPWNFLLLLYWLSVTCIMSLGMILNAKQVGLVGQDLLPRPFSFHLWYLIGEHNLVEKNKIGRQCICWNYRNLGGWKERIHSIYFFFFFFLWKKLIIYTISIDICCSMMCYERQSNSLYLQ